MSAPTIERTNPSSAVRVRERLESRQVSTERPYGASRARRQSTRRDARAAAVAASLRGD